MRATTSSMCAAVISTGGARSGGGGSGHVGAAASAHARRRRPPRSPAVGQCATWASPRVKPRLRASFVEHVDRAVRQLVVAQVPRGELRRRLQRVVVEADLMMRLVARPQTLEDPHRLLDARLVDRDALQPTRQRAVLFDVLELLVRRRSDDPELTGREDWLDQRGQVHRAAGRRARADGGVDLVDEQDRHRPLRQRVDDRLEALLEVSAESRAGEQRAGVEREHLRALEQIRHVVLQQPWTRALRRARSCRRPRRRRTPGCSCAGGRGSPSSAAARRRGR